MKSKVIQFKKKRCYDAGYLKPGVKFEIYGEALLEKKVGKNGNCGRLYLPGDWVGHRVKIIRMD